MFLPVYKNNVSHETVEEKQNALAGFVYVAFRAYDLFNAMLPNLSEIQHDDIQIKVYDAEKSE